MPLSAFLCQGRVTGERSARASLLWPHFTDEGNQDPLSFIPNTPTHFQAGGAGLGHPAESCRPGPPGARRADPSCIIKYNKSADNRDNGAVCSGPWEPWTGRGAALPEEGARERDCEKPDAAEGSAGAEGSWGAPVTTTRGGSQLGRRRPGRGPGGGRPVGSGRGLELGDGLDAR